MSSRRIASLVLCAIGGLLACLAVVLVLLGDRPDLVPFCVLASCILISMGVSGVLMNQTK